MSEYRKLVAKFLERYEKPVVEEYIQGFSGIDPPRKQNAGILDHEQLNGLLGGNLKEHYHLTKEQLDWLISQMDGAQPVILEGQVINITANEKMSPYEVQGENVRI